MHKTRVNSGYLKVDYQTALEQHNSATGRRGLPRGGGYCVFSYLLFRFSDDHVVAAAQAHLAQLLPEAVVDPDFERCFAEMFHGPQGIKRGGHSDLLLHDGGGSPNDISYTCEVGLAEHSYTILTLEKYSCLILRTYFSNYTFFQLCSSVSGPKVLTGFGELSSHCLSNKHLARRRAAREEGQFPRFIDCTAKGV